jgi:hypothetical protein
MSKYIVTLITEVEAEDDKEAGRVAFRKLMGGFGYTDAIHADILVDPKPLEF